MSGSAEKDAGKGKNAGKGKGEGLKRVESEGAKAAAEASRAAIQRINEVLRKYADEFKTPEAPARQAEYLEGWRLRMKARAVPIGDSWTLVYEDDRRMLEKSEAKVSSETPTSAVTFRKSDRDATEAFFDDSVEEGVINLGFIPQLEDVVQALEEIRQDCHYDALSHRIPGVSPRTLSALRWSLNNDPSLICRALNPKPRNLAIQAARRVASLLGAGLGNFDPEDESYDNQSLASKAEILLVMEHVCPNAFAHVPTEKRALAKWWGECDLKRHPNSRGYGPTWGPKIRGYFGIPESIP